MEINRDDVVSELTSVFERYEHALVAGDNDTLVSYFWADPALVRFGLADQQRGIDELSAWRREQPPTPRGRRLYDTVVATFGTGFAVISTCFDYPDGQQAGRQSQTWVRTAEGWRIVAAHVSWSMS